MWKKKINKITNIRKILVSNFQTVEREHLRNFEKCCSTTRVLVCKYIATTIKDNLRGTVYKTSGDDQSKLRQESIEAQGLINWSHH